MTGAAATPWHTPAPMTDPDSADPEGRATIDDAEAPARTTLPDPEVHAPPRTTLPDVEGAGADEAGEPADPEDAEPPPPEAPKVKRSAWVYFLVGGLLFAALSGPLLFYFFVWRYRPTAVQHIPEGTTAALRVDGNELYLFDPFREHVLSALAESDGISTRADRFRKATGIDPRADIREIVVATTDGQGVVVLLGGKFERTRLSQDRFVVSLARFLENEGVKGFALEGEVLVGRGLRIAQADDFTIIVATHEEGLRAALEPSDAWTRLGIASSGAASFVIDRPALAAAARNLPPSAAPPFSNAERVTGFLKLGGKEPSLFVDVSPTTGTTPEALAKDVEGAIDAAKLLTVLLPDVAGEKAVLANAKVKPRAKSVMIEATWPREGLEAACKRGGDALRALFGAPPAPP